MQKEAAINRRHLHPVRSLLAASDLHYIEREREREMLIQLASLMRTNLRPCFGPPGGWPTGNETQQGPYATCTTAWSQHTHEVLGGVPQGTFGPCMIRGHARLSSPALAGMGDAIIYVGVGLQARKARPDGCGAWSEAARSAAEAGAQMAPSELNAPPCHGSCARRLALR